MNSQHYNIFTGELPECLQMRAIGDILGATLRCLPVHDRMLGRLSVSNGKEAVTVASPYVFSNAVEESTNKVTAKQADNCKLPGKARLNFHYGRRRRFFGMKNVIKRKLYSIPLVAGILF